VSTAPTAASATAPAPAPAPATSPPPALVAEVVVRHGDRIVDVRHLAGGHYVIGEAATADFVVQLPPGVDRAGVPLVIVLADQLVFGLVPGMTGELVRGDATLQLTDLLAQGRRSYPIARGDRCEARLGDLTFSIATVDPAAYAPARRPVDRLYWLSNAGALLVAGALVLLGDPRPPGELAPGEVTASRALAVRYLTDLPPPPPQPDPPPRASATPVPKARPARPAAPPPPAASDPLHEVAVPGAVATIPRPGKRGIRQTHEEARGAGVLGDAEFIDSVGRTAADAQEGLLAYADDADDQKFWDGVATGPARVRPFGGLELAETERGGGAHGEKQVSSTAAGKRVTVDTSGGPGPTAEERAAARRVVAIAFTTPNVRGDMNPDSVQTALRNQSDGLRACYKKATGLDNREGQVLLRIKVDAAGRVTSASLDFASKSLGDIGPCVTAAARAWKFPPPLDGKPASIVVEAGFTAKSY
jgi:TonB family protein